MNVPTVWQPAFPERPSPWISASETGRHTDAVYQKFRREVVDNANVELERTPDRRKRSQIRPSARARVIERDNGRCYLCKRATTTVLGPRSAAYPTIDHVVPVNAGGSSSLDNLRLAHRICNERKDTILPWEVEELNTALEEARWMMESLPVAWEDVPVLEPGPDGWVQVPEYHRELDPGDDLMLEP